MKWQYSGKGFFELNAPERGVLRAHAVGFATDGREIDTRTAELTEQKCIGENRLELCFQEENGLCLKETLEILPGGVPTAQCRLSGKDEAEIESRKLVPLVIQAPQEKQSEIWKSIWSKMLLVPYDNTMWLRYEAVHLRAGRKSYDMTVLFQEKSREGLLIGALDFDIWKNALVCSATDAKTLDAVCGVADEGSHDSRPHGSMAGTEVASSRFCILYGEDYRRLLEQYGDLIKEERRPLTWKEGVPFGFNSWAGLAFRLNAENYKETARFMREELRSAGFENRGVNYCNLDAGWNAIPEETLIEQVRELHANGQKAGIYDAPFAFFGQDVKQEIPGVPGHIFEEILLRDESGRLLPRVDGAIPFDVTHPVWCQYTARKLQRFVDWDFDYVKLDFMTHGGMEGCHSDKAIRTGRQALHAGYEFIARFLAPEKIGKPFFISLSIAPLFPCGYGHARRFSCDAFGTAEDVEYVLNAQTWAWWTNGRLYQYNDPDHICLLQSFGMERESSLGEARARYTAAVIAGTVMMLSDDFARPEARERALTFSGNREVNALAASGTAFVPVESNGGSASAAYTGTVDGTRYVALFHWEDKAETVCLDCGRAGLKEGTAYRELWSGQTFRDAEGTLRWDAEGCDCILLKEL